MSSLFLIAPFFAFLTCIGVWIALRFFVAKNSTNNRRLASCLISVLLFPVVTAGFFVALPLAMSKSGTDATPHIANQALVTFDVPSSATAVDFRHAFFSGTIDEANFSIDEVDFKNWLASNGWKSRELVTDQNGSRWKDSALHDEKDNEIRVRPIRLRGTESKYLAIKNGYVFSSQDPRHPDSGFNIVYDKDTNRAYVWRTTY